MPEYDDSVRLDAIGEYGLTVVCDQQLVNSEWKELWRCHALSMGPDAAFFGPSIREVIDLAINYCKSQMN